MALKPRSAKSCPGSAVRERQSRVQPQASFSPCPPPFTRCTNHFRPAARALPTPSDSTSRRSHLPKPNTVLDHPRRSKPLHLRAPRPQECSNIRKNSGVRAGVPSSPLFCPLSGLQTSSQCPCSSEGVSPALSGVQGPQLCGRGSHGNERTLFAPARMR